MRQELKQIQYIEEYLLGKLSAEETIKFEEKIAKDKEFAKDVELQRIVMKRVKVVAIKKEIQKAHKRNTGNRNRFKNKNFRRGGIIILCIAALIAALLSGKDLIKKDNTSDAQENFIEPPIPKADVPKTAYTVNADSGRLITHSSGSMIYIPKHAFLDANGNVVKGDVKVEYREFKDPIDFYLAGIPMNVDVDGQQYTMESAAMCEINANMDGKPLQVNPDNKISVFQTSNTSSNAFDLYYLDTVRRQWVVKGKDKPLNTTEYTYSNQDNGPEERFNEEIVKPVKPGMANIERYSFTIDFDVEELPELEGFQNVIFEIHEDEERYNPDDGDVLWENVDIRRGEKAGTYLVIFSKSQNYDIAIQKKTKEGTSPVSSGKSKTKRSVEYLTRPVFEGAAYDEAMELYTKKLSEYKRKRNKRHSKESEERMAIRMHNQRVDSINTALEARNRVILARNQKIDSLNTLTAQRNDSIEYTYRYNENRKPDRNQVLNTDLNFKRCELLRFNALTPLQQRKITEPDKKDLYTIKEYINQLYTANQEYIDLCTKRDYIISSDLIPAEEKERYASMGKEEILKAGEDINQRNKSLTSWSTNRFRDRIFREFEIDGFGIWNCDMLNINMLPGTAMKAEFYDVYADIYLTQVMLVDGTRNSLVRVNRSMFSFFGYDPTHKNVIWTVTPDHNRILYFNDFENVPDTTEYTFPMEIIQLDKRRYDNYAEFRGLLKGLME